MKILRTLAVTFAQYSRIPMPRFEWKAEDMRFCMAAFPLVGAVIGLAFEALFKVCAALGVPQTAAALLMTALPLMITGGFHLDGFMDMSDALSSFKSREEKLAIMKDPHIGAFAVIRTAVTGLIYTASLVTVLCSDHAALLVHAVAAGFVMSRGLSALAVLTLKPAKSEGMLRYESDAADGAKKINIIISALWTAASAFVMSYVSYPAGCIVIFAAPLCFAWYKYISYKELGGITGDTAGWFVVVCETAMAAAAAASSLITG